MHRKVRNMRRKVGIGWGGGYIYASTLQQVSFGGLLGPSRLQLVTCWRVLVCILCCSSQRKAQRFEHFELCLLQAQRFTLWMFLDPFCMTELYSGYMLRTYTKYTSSKTLGQTAPTLLHTKIRAFFAIYQNYWQHDSVQVLAKYPMQAGQGQVERVRETGSVFLAMPCQKTLHIFKLERIGH